jgi:hydrogenase expression/formation protein HypE
MSEAKPFTLTCPLPIASRDQVQLAHGGGGKLMHELLEQLVLPVIGNPILETRHDGAVLGLQGARFAFTTDSYVVHPLFFPGGDIGTLAVNGTANDLAMCGARPLYLSAGLILEEGLPLDTLRRVLNSMRRSASTVGVQFVTGDTKVVDKGKGDGIFINTAGIGVIEHQLSIVPASVRAGDAVLLSGDIGRHGVAVMAVREGLEFETTIESDCAPLVDPVQALLRAGIEVHCLRDLTRGGLATALIEIAVTAHLDIEIREAAIPVEESIHGACEILGFDPLYLANEGRFVAFLPQSQVQYALDALQQHTVCAGAAQIGKVGEGLAGVVTLKNRIGTSRVLDMLSGEQLPRIC